MGAAQSSNVVSAVQKVTNDVSNSTKANSQQVNNLKQEMEVSNCFIQADNFNVNYASELSIQNSQISKAVQNSSVKNDLQQKILQEATSSIGSMGVGYASASNSASMFVNATTDIVNAMETGSSQFSSTDQSFVCDHSTIIAKDLNIDFSGKSDFLSTQTLDNSQVSDIVNKISQSATQKAIAKVEGLAGFLIALAVLIGAIGYSVAKPLSSGGGKIIIVMIVLIVILLTGVAMYIGKTPPFFNDDIDCAKHSDMGGCRTNCINFTEQTKKLDNSPLRYIYGLISGDSSKSTANLLEIAVGSGEGDSKTNGGYNATRANELRSKLNIIVKNLQDKNLIKDSDLPPQILNIEKYKIPEQYLKSGNSDDVGKCTPSALQGVGPITNFDSCPQYGTPITTTSDTKSSTTLASLNINGWKDYLSSDDDNLTRTKLSRFILYILISENPLTIYISDDELVRFNNKDGNIVIGLAKDHKDECYKFSPSSINNFRDGINSGGTLSGMFGICNDNNYKLHKFMRKIGIWIILVIVLIFFAFLFYQWKFNKNKKEQTNK